MRLVLCTFLIIISIASTSYGQVTSPSYADSEDEIHSNQIPPPGNQPSEDEIKNEMENLITKTIDTDGDSKINTEELAKWLDIVHHKIIEDTINRQWVYYQPQVQEVHSWEGYAPETKEVLSWENFVALTYPDEYMKDDPSNIHFKSMQALHKRSQKRWQLADANNDNVLTKDEFRDFIHPEESEKVREVLVDEAMEDMDKDSDGKITFAEYMNQMKAVSDEADVDSNEWGTAQEDQFKSFLDKNNDGMLDREELREWLLPSYNKHEAQAYQLITSADEDKDNELSKEEILDQYQVFYSILPPEFWAKMLPEETSTSSHDEL